LLITPKGREHFDFFYDEWLLILVIFCVLNGSNHTTFKGIINANPSSGCR